ncbi:MAG TPA: hypothetical protein VIG33_17910, partial [Pseudobdellovibrionaceae bacterium]
MKWGSLITERIDLFPTFFSGAMFLVCLIGFIDFFKGAPRRALLAFILFLCFPIARWHLTTAYMDPTLMVGILATFMSAAAYLNHRKDKYFYLLAFFSAVSFSVKHFGAFYALPIVLWAFIELIRQEKRLRWGLLIQALALALLPIIVFYHYNYVTTGSFFFPFVFTENNQLFWDLDSVKSFNAAINAFSGGSGFLDLLKLPLTIGTSEKHSDTSQFAVGLLWAPVWLIANCIFFFRRYKKKPFDPVEFLFFTTVNLQTIIWYKTSPVFRYLTCEMMLMSLFALWITE